MPAVANAVYDAVGVRVDQIPVTPEKILRALQAKAAGKPARSGPASFPEIAWPEPLLVDPAVGRRRRPRLERTAERDRGARPTPASKPRRGCAS